MGINNSGIYKIVGEKILIPGYGCNTRQPGEIA
jgi:hypothetical protein